MKLLLLLMFVVSGCVSGPRDNRSPVEKLNGQNYEGNGNVAGIPVLERKPLRREFAGHVFCGAGIAQYPANHAVVALIENGQISKSSTTAVDGSYMISSPITPDSKYMLKARANCGTQARALDENELRGLSGANFYIAL